MSTTPHLFWITSRAAGIAALLASTAAVAIGLLMSTRLRKSADFKALQQDSVSLPAQALIKLLKEEAGKAGAASTEAALLINWDGHLSVDAQAGPLY